MTPEQINRAIAEHCGWHHFISNDEYGNARALRPYEEAKTGCVFTDIPNYNGDLNAMHEAEKELPDEAAGVYEGHIYEVCKVQPDTIFASDLRKVICATAAQRAEAFLRTVNKWKE